MVYFNHTFLTNMFRPLLMPSSEWNYYKNTKIQMRILTFICPCIASISLKYNQQDATFSRSVYFYKLLHMLLSVLFGCYLCRSMYCLCVNVYCHRVTTQLQLINISYISRFRRFLRPLSGAQNCTYSVRYCQTNTAACCYRE